MWRVQGKYDELSLAKLQNTRPTDLHTLNNNSVHCNISRSSKTRTPGPGLLPTSFPGSLLFTPQEAREERPWLGLVTCLPKSGRLQISDLGEGRLSVSLPILSEPGMGKHAPVIINLQNRACFKGRVKWSSKNP